MPLSSTKRDYFFHMLAYHSNGVTTQSYLVLLLPKKKSWPLKRKMGFKYGGDDYMTILLSPSSFALQFIYHRFIAAVTCSASLWQLAPLVSGSERCQNTRFLDASQRYWSTTKSNPASKLMSPTSHTWFSHRGGSTDTININVRSRVKTKA